MKPGPSISGISNSKSLLRLAFFALFSVPLWAAPPRANSPASYNHSFQVGEQLHYTVHWTYFKAGYAYMRVLESKKYLGTDCLVFRSGARSVGFLGKIFRVKDRIISYWDPVAKRTLYSKKDLREGNYFRHAEVYFNPRKGSAKWTSRSFSGNAKEIGKKKKGAKWKYKKGLAKDLPLQIQDMLSAVYYNRSSEKKGRAGDVFHIDVFDDDELVKLKMEILREESLPMKINGVEKEMKAWVVKPHITSTGVFRVKGEVLVWISKDRRRFPLLIKAEAPVLGHVYVKLYRTINTIDI